MHIDSHFDSGNIEVVELLDNNTANLRIQMDAGDEHMQWFHFRVDGATGEEVTLRIVNAGGGKLPQSMERLPSVYECRPADLDAGGYHI